MTYAEIVQHFTALAGKRVRLTFPNTVQIVGICGTHLTRNDDPRGPHATMDGRFKGGELEGATRLEVMAGNGRYQIVADRPDLRQRYLDERARVMAKRRARTTAP